MSVWPFPFRFLSDTGVLLEQTTLLLQLRLLPGGQLIVLLLAQPERLLVVELVQVQLELGRIDALRQRAFEQHGQRVLFAGQQRQAVVDGLRCRFTTILQ